MRRQGFTLAELAAAIVAAAILASLILPAWLRVRRNDRIRACSANLSALWKASKDGAAAPGPAFWKASTPALLLCPVKGGAAAEGGDYRGPAATIVSYGENDPVGADRPANHSHGGPSEGGNVLLKSGAVQTVIPDDELWIAAGRLTK